MMSKAKNSGGYMLCGFLIWVIIAACTGVGKDQASKVIPEYSLSVNWTKVESISKTSLSIQVCPEPPMRRGHPASKNIYKALRDMSINYARLQPWFPYPRLGVAELQEPKNGKTFWDFSEIDPLVLDFFAAAEGRPVMLNFSTIPQWMMKTEKPVPYPEDPDEISWKYSEGRELRDSSLKELVDYYHRLFSWYAKGGFTDEQGKFHQSGYHFKIAYWEVLNESDQDTQHEFSPQQLTKIYDAVVTDLRKLDPDMKFSCLALAFPQKGDPYVAYFLDARNHQPGIPLDMFSYHFYIGADGDKWRTGDDLKKQQSGYFERADYFLQVVSRLDSIKQKLSPETKTYVNELGTLPAGDPTDRHLQIPDYYWPLSAATFAYAYAGLVKRGIDVVAIAELIDYPGQFAGTTLVDWNTGKPNARYWGMKLLRDNFGMNDQLVESKQSDKAILFQGFITAAGEHKILVVNKTNQPIRISVPGGGSCHIRYVDESTGNNPPADLNVKGGAGDLGAFAVAVITPDK